MLPGHTKLYFKEYNILTVQGVIALNALLFIHKVRHFPLSTPKSLRDTIPHNSPTPGSTYETCESWLATYNNTHYRSSLFFKGLTLSIIPEVAQLLTPGSCLKINTYKSNVKSYLLKVQSEGKESEWQPSNFILTNVPGLRRSNRINSDGILNSDP